MSHTISPSTMSIEFQLCFRSLFKIGRGFAFPCDVDGRVHMDSLSHRARDNFLFARAMVGRELQLPIVEKVCCAAATVGDGTLYPPQHASMWGA